MLYQSTTPCYISGLHQANWACYISTSHGFYTVPMENTTLCYIRTLYHAISACYISTQYHIISGHHIMLYQGTVELYIRAPHSALLGHWSCYIKAPQPGSSGQIAMLHQARFHTLKKMVKAPITAFWSKAFLMWPVGNTSSYSSPEPGCPLLPQSKIK